MGAWTAQCKGRNHPHPRTNPFDIIRRRTDSAAGPRAAATAAMDLDAALKVKFSETENYRLPLAIAGKTTLFPPGRAGAPGAVRSRQLRRNRPSVSRQREKPRFFPGPRRRARSRALRATLPKSPRRFRPIKNKKAPRAGEVARGARESEHRGSCSQFGGEAHRTPKQKQRLCQTTQSFKNRDLGKARDGLGSDANCQVWTEALCQVSSRVSAATPERRPATVFSTYRKARAPWLRPPPTPGV